jgi:probable rRNA maturation factor
VSFRLELSGASPVFPLCIESLSDEIERSLAPLLGDVNASAVVTCVSDDVMRELNAHYRGLDEATDVLSFPLWEEGGRFVPPPGWKELPLGDVVVSPDFVRANAARENIGYNNEIARMVVHGVLHLVGYGHDTEERERSMWELQESIVAGYERSA